MASGSRKTGKGRRKLAMSYTHMMARLGVRKEDAGKGGRGNPGANQGII
jgi:hypothetical protein